MRAGGRSSFGRVAALVAVAAAVAPVVGTTTVADATTTGFSVYVVNSTSDATDSAGSGLCATQPPTTAKPCTLRAAIVEGNAQTGVTVNVPAGVYALTAGGLTISKPMTIVGAANQPGPTATTIDGGGKDRVFKTAATGVTIDGVVIRNGVVPKGSSNYSTGSEGQSFDVSGDGGGILVASGSLALKRSTLSGNSAREGGGLDIDAPTTITQSTITGNTASSTGGGITSDDTVTVENSTVTGNTAPRGGGLWSSRTATVRASTITANTATSGNGGGIYRSGGALTITGSILAGNTASTAPNCYGGPTFSGTNIVQTTTGCSPTGSAVLAVDPRLGPLADNGGSTQTQRPVAGSPALDAYATAGLPPVCVTAVDQRGVARPQPTGGRCDVGAQESLALGLDLSLATSSDSIPAGTGTVPFANIPLTALDPAAARDERDRKLCVQALGVQALGVQALRLRLRRVQALGVQAFRVQAFRVQALRVRFRGGREPAPRGRTHRSARHDPADRRGVGPARRLARVPDRYAVRRCAAQHVDLRPGRPAARQRGNHGGPGRLRATALGSLPEISLLLGATPLRSIALTPALETATDAQRLAAWCTALTSPSQNPCATLRNDPDLTLLAVSLAGFSIDGAGIEQVLAKDVAAADAPVFGELSLNGLVQMGASLGAIPVSALPAGYVTCAPTSCPTLIAAATLNAVNLDKSLLDLLTDPAAAAIPQVATFTLAALITTLLPPDFQQWQTLDIASTPLQNVAEPTEPVETYTAALAVKGDRPAATTVQLTLPPGFVVVPGTFKVDGTVQTDPTPDADNVAHARARHPRARRAHRRDRNTAPASRTGPAVADAVGTATAGGDTATATSSKSVTVTEAFENGGIATCRDIDPCATANLQPNVLNLAHISSKTDRDFYRFTVPATPGQKTHASIVLSNLPADYDLVLYGPATQPAAQRAAAERATP